MDGIHFSDPLTSNTSSQSAVGQSQLVALMEVKSQQSPVSITPPQSEWSSLIADNPEENPQKILYAASCKAEGKICDQYIEQSASEILRHPYYKFPQVTDPGIKKALLKSEPKQLLPDDGQEIYEACCQEMGHAPVRLFLQNILSPEIDLKYYGIRKNHFRAMAKALMRNRNVKILNLTDNFLSVDDCYHIGQVLFCNTTLSDLIIAGCRIGPHGFLRMKSGLEANRKLMKIDLSRNHLGDEGGVLFAQHIIEGGSTPIVNLSNNALGIKTASRLARAARASCELTHLDLSWNNFYSEEPVANMINSLAKSTVLKAVNLSWNGLRGNVVAKAIGNLFLCPSLKKINLSNNKLSGEDILIPITSKLPNSQSVKLLNLSSNPITQTYATSILEIMLNPGVKLKTLLLDDIRVNGKFFECLEMIKTMESRNKFKVTYGDVDVIKPPSQIDARKIIVLRADFLCRSSVKNKMDFAVYMFRIAREFHEQIDSKDLVERVANDHAPLDEDLINGLVAAFPVPPKTAKEAKETKNKDSYGALDLNALVEYIHMMWPQKRIPTLAPRRSLGINKKKTPRKANKAKGK